MASLVSQAQRKGKEGKNELSHKGLTYWVQHKGKEG